MRSHSEGLHCSRYRGPCSGAARGIGHDACPQAFFNRADHCYATALEALRRGGADRLKAVLLELKPVAAECLNG